ncbi:MAG: DUF1254 domain-containing protein, partial [Gemmatimonadetes bacterium]|nr:DUF1254 domain-containing protein [Gemmatimonadota bacterium]
MKPRQRTGFALAIALMSAVLTTTGVQAQAQEDTYPNEAMTHIGELTFDHGIPTEETSEKLYYEMDYHRAVQVYLWSLPIMGQAQWRQSYLDLYDMKPNQMVYATQFDDRSQILTANETTPYLFGWTNVKDKAAVFEVPPGAVIGLGIDFWQRGLDYGLFGPNAGKGGTWVITGPETPQSEIPYVEGARLIESQTNNVWLVSRLSMPAGERDQVVSGFKLYYNGETPRAASIISSDNKPGRNYQPRGMKYWELLHAI